LFPLGKRFMVIATQNPIEQQGTYPLPEAQLDRFIFKHVLDYPKREEEIEIVRRHGSRTGSPKPKDLGVKAVVSRKDIDAAVDVVSTVRLTDEVTHYVVDLVRGTRNNPLFPALWALGAAWIAGLIGLIIIDIFLSPKRKDMEFEVKAPRSFFIGETEQVWFKYDYGVSKSFAPRSPECRLSVNDRF